MRLGSWASSWPVTATRRWRRGRMHRRPLRRPVDVREDSGLRQAGGDSRRSGGARGSSDVGGASAVAGSCPPLPVGRLGGAARATPDPVADRAGSEQRLSEAPARSSDGFSPWERVPETPLRRPWQASITYPATPGPCKYTKVEKLRRSLGGRCESS